MRKEKKPWEQDGVRQPMQKQRSTHYFVAVIRRMCCKRKQSKAVCYLFVPRPKFTPSIMVDVTKPVRVQLPSSQNAHMRISTSSEQRVRYIPYRHRKTVELRTPRVLQERTSHTSRLVLLCVYFTLQKINSFLEN